MDAVSDRAIRDAGTSEEAWQPWLAQRAIRTLSLDALCRDAARLVVVAPHPDDEVLACGGLLGGALRQGRACHVIAVTDGEASHGTHDSPSQARLGARRVEESHAGLRELGLASPEVTRLGIPDGAVAAHMAELAVRLQALLRPQDLAVTTWQLDGHPDHEATGEAVKRACARVGCRLLQAPVWMWHWSEPGDGRVPWHRLVAFDVPLAGMAMKRAALHHHLSQFEDRGDAAGPVLVPSIVERASRTREYFFVEDFDA